MKILVLTSLVLVLANFSYSQNTMSVLKHTKNTTTLTKNINNNTTETKTTILLSQLNDSMEIVKIRVPKKEKLQPKSEHFIKQVFGGRAHKIIRTA